MKIHNLRLSFACNSSSTHSIVMLDPGVTAQDKDANGCYGWDFFTLASKEAKTEYMALQLYNNLRKQLHPAISRIVVEDWYGVSLEGEDADAYIDHQSAFNFPLQQMDDNYSKSRAVIDKGFALAVLNTITQEGVVICGGNDNTDTEHQLKEKSTDYRPEVFLPTGSNWRSRYDETNHYWTIFNESNGNKLRFSFDENMPVDATKASAPELVDIKITDSCSFRCDFCYMGSTPQGKVAKLSNIEIVAQQLKAVGVFEVAIGGGEPTEHPDFVRILETFRGLGIVPNFTTASLAWLKGPNADKIIQLCGRFAFSPMRYNSLAKLLAHIELNDYLYPDKVTVQMVVGADRQDSLEEKLGTCFANHLAVTLLGFKKTGRGKTFKQHDVDMFQAVKNAPSPLPKWGRSRLVGIDTVLAKEGRLELLANLVPGGMFTIHEGTHSMYIDAVEMKMGPSSYCDPQDMTTFRPYGLVGQIKKHFPYEPK